MLSSGGKEVCLPQGGKKGNDLLFSDVSEEMYNRIIWWLKGLCFSLLCVHRGGMGGRGTVGRVASVYLQS